MALDEAAGDDDAFALASGFLLDGLVDFAEGFILGGFEEAAGVDDDGIGLIGVGGDGQAILGEEAEHALGVHEVFRAAEADEGDGVDGGGFAADLLRHGGSVWDESNRVKILHG